MAAVAAEPGAAVVPITTTTTAAATDDEAGHLEPGLGGPSSRGAGALAPEPEHDEYAPVMDLVVDPHLKDGDVVVVEECGHVVRPELEEAAAGKAFISRAGGGEEEIVTVASDGGDCRLPSLSGRAGERLMAVERFSSPAAVVEAEVGSGNNVQQASVYHQSITTSDSQPSAVFLHSFPAHPPVTEAGLSLAEPAEPTTTTNDYYRNRIEPRTSQPVDIIIDGYTALIKQPELVGPNPEPAENNPVSAIYKDVAEDAGLLRDGTVTALKDSQGVHVALRTASSDMDTATAYINNCDFSSSSSSAAATQNKNYPAVKDELPVVLTGLAGSVTVPPANVTSTSSSSVSASRTLQQQDPAACPSSSPCRSPKRRLIIDPTHLKQEKLGCMMGLEPPATAADPGSGAESKPSLPCHHVVSEPPCSSMDQLTPGSEVRVSLDHIIDDALVVSFRVGEKIFSGVLMDLSKRFGPYGIPITVFPKRDYKDRPQLTMQLQPTQQQQPLQEPERPDGVNAKTHADLDIACSEGPDHQRLRGEGQAVAATPQPSQTAPPPHPWSSKPPPLFQEGAPYPPPLFIRDTYNQALPQPPPRKIKRPKRRYRCEEPTSIMNAIKLRPRQVLCDKCKCAVGSGNSGVPREGRRATPASSDSRGEDATKRRRQADGGSVVTKRLRNETSREDKGARGVSDRRSASGLRVSSGSSSGRIPRGVASSSPVSHSANSSRVRLKLNSKQKVLGAKGSAVECSKARHVLKKLSRTSQPRIQSTQITSQQTPHHRRQPKDSSASANRPLTGPKTMTRSASLQEASQSQKIHFTRRLQHLNTAVVGSNPRATPLPPRMRIKPQRYRTEDNQVSPPHPPPKQQLRLPSVRANARTAPPPKQPALSPDPHPSPVQAVAQPLLVQTPPPAANISPDVPTCPPVPSLSSSPSASAGVTSLAVEVREVPPRQPEREGGEAEEHEKRGIAGGCTEEGEGVSQGGASLVVYVSAEASSSHPQADSSSSSGSLDLEDLKSTNSECSSTETFDLLPPGDLLIHSSYCSSSSYSSSSTPPPPPSFSSQSLPSASSSSSVALSDTSAPPSLALPPQGSEEGQGEEMVTEGEGEGVVGEDEAGGGEEEPKRRRKSSTCSSSSSSSSSKTPTFTKSVLKCAAPDGRTVCVGDIVWAKIYGFPWWPARVLGITVSRGSGTGPAVLQEARVSWFGSPTTSFLPLAQVAPFLESFQTRFDKKRRGPYRRAITEAARAAKQLTPEVRALLTQFET